jgi:hypothetical protein
MKGWRKGDREVQIQIQIQKGLASQVLHWKPIPNRNHQRGAMQKKIRVSTKAHLSYSN